MGPSLLGPVANYRTFQICSVRRKLFRTIQFCLLQIELVEVGQSIWGRLEYCDLEWSRNKVVINNKNFLHRCNERIVLSPWKSSNYQYCDTSFWNTFKRCSAYFLFFFFFVHLAPSSSRLGEPRGSAKKSLLSCLTLRSLLHTLMNSVNWVACGLNNDWISKKVARIYVLSHEKRGRNCNESFEATGENYTWRCTGFHDEQAVRLLSMRDLIECGTEEHRLSESRMLNGHSAALDSGTVEKHRIKES